MPYVREMRMDLDRIVYGTQTEVTEGINSIISKIILTKAQHTVRPGRPKHEAQTRYESKLQA